MNHGEVTDSWLEKIVGKKLFFHHRPQFGCLTFHLISLCFPRSVLLLPCLDSPVPSCYHSMFLLLSASVHIVIQASFIPQWSIFLVLCHRYLIVSSVLASIFNLLLCNINLFVCFLKNKKF